MRKFVKSPKGGKTRGIALIMALYVTVILLALGTFFIADQINKSKSVKDYQDSGLALQGANAGLNYMINYLGPSRSDWADAILLRDSKGNTVCGNDTFNYANNSITITANNGTLPWFKPVAGGLYETDYQFQLGNAIQVSDVEQKYAVIGGTLKLFTLTAENGCIPGDSATTDLSSVTIDITAQVENKAQNYVYASREVLWSGKRNFYDPHEHVLCYNCADFIGTRPPNTYDNLDNAAYLGNGYTANEVTGDLGQQTSTDTSNNVASSPYGSDTNSDLTVKGTAKLNGTVETDNPSGVSGVPTSNESTSSQAVPLPTGASFGPAQGGTNPDAPNAMLQDFQQAAGSSSCNSGIKTVFVDSSQDVGQGAPGGTAHDIEYPSNLGAQQKPGYAVVDVTLTPVVNSNNITDTLVTINQLGYYSGNTLYSESFYMSQFNSGQGGAIYVQGGNVRIHGDLANSGLSVVANQGEALYAQGSTTPINLSSVSGFNANCVATDPNLPSVSGGTLINTANRINSQYGGPKYIGNSLNPSGSQGMDYWIPNACPSNNCTGTAWTPSPSSNACSNCIVDGIYFTSYNGDPSSTANSIAGYHADDVNGQPLTLSGVSGVSCSGSNCTATTTDSADFQNTIFAPPPTYNSDGTYQTGSAILQPTLVTCTSCAGSPTKMVWPYPGASALQAIQNGQSDDNLAYTRQQEYSEGNLTISGDTTYNTPIPGQNNTTVTGTAYGLGLFAQNYVMLDDFAAGTTSNSINGTKNALGLDVTNVNAVVLSANHSVQWQGNAVADPTYPSDSYLNGDYTAMNNQCYNCRIGNNPPANSTYTQTFYYVNSQGKVQSSTVQADSWQGAPLSSTNISPLEQTNNSWGVNITGSISAQYDDIVNVSDGSGNLTGYGNETLSSDSRNTPPAVPLLPFTDYQGTGGGGWTAYYLTLSYTDLGALQSTSAP